MKKQKASIKALKMITFVKFCIKLINLYNKRGQNYFIFQKFQAENIIKTLKNKLNLTCNSTVIDYGCGYGGYSSVLADYFQQVKAVDYYSSSQISEKQNINYEKADLISYKTAPVDFIFCTSVIEHIPKEKQALFVENIKDNLKKRGYLYLSFPPFLSLQGGHATYPFHYFPDKTAFFLTKIFRKANITSYSTMWGDWGLYKTSIKEVETMLLDNNFKIIEINSRFMPKWYSKFFGKIDFLNWHVEFIAQKRG
ncbi:MAG TPA: methyltransferase domain-containing protein [Candidatus Gastranaerophilales bacterium]|nr:methyltransferase domain-containing protein [Candidatus Gastranaerophilales bacterium]